MFHVPWDMVQFPGGLSQADFGHLILIGILVNRGDGRGAVVVRGADVKGVTGVADRPDEGSVNAWQS